MSEANAAPPKVPSAAEVVVIGGGAVGSSTLYHLAALGMAEPLLLERDKLTSGTSWHSAAQVRALRSTENLTRLIQYSAQLYQSLEHETGLSTGWVQTGSLSIASNAARLEHIKRQASLARLFGVNATLLESKEAGRIWPLMRTDDIVGAVFSPQDGRVNPSDLCASLIRGASRRGAKVVEHCPVTGIHVENGRVAAVQTKNGKIECRKIIVCAGLWSRQVAAMAGAIAPLYACEHYYLLTQPLAGINGHLPTLGDHDRHLYIRDDVGGLLVGSFEPNAKPIALDKLPNNFSFDLLGEDWDHFEPMLENAIHRIPALAEAESRMLLNGPESFTPDGGFLLGESPEVEGLFFGCGMNSMGLASSGGAGWALAEWVVNGRPPFDLSPVDVRRFSRADNNNHFLRERTPEILSNHYALSFPNRDEQSSRGRRRSAVFEQLRRAGAVFSERGGWERVAWVHPEGPGAAAQLQTQGLRFGAPVFDDILRAECHAARTGVVLIDQSTFGKLLVQGPNALDLLERVCANRVDVPTGRCVYTAMLNERGGYESDFTLLRLATDQFLIVTGTSQVARDRAWLEQHRRTAEVVYITDLSPAWSVLGIHGPDCLKLLQPLTPTNLSLAEFPYFHFRDIELGPVQARALRLAYSGEAGFELQIPADQAPAAFDVLCEAGAALNLRLAGNQALNSLRIEKGFRSWGHDIGPDDTPFEAGLHGFVRENKSVDFVGKTALAGSRERARRRRLVFITCNDNNARPQGGEPIVCDGQYVGQLSSAAFGYTLGRGVGMGYIRCDGSSHSTIESMLEDGQFQIEIALERFRVQASLQPYYDPGSERARIATSS